MSASGSSENVVMTWHTAWRHIQKSATFIFKVVLISTTKVLKAHISQMNVASTEKYYPLVSLISVCVFAFCEHCVLICHRRLICAL